MVGIVPFAPRSHTQSCARYRNRPAHRRTTYAGGKYQSVHEHHSEEISRSARAGATKKYGGDPAGLVVLPAVPTAELIAGVLRRVPPAAGFMSSVGESKGPAGADGSR